MDKHVFSKTAHQHHFERVDANIRIERRVKDLNLVSLPKDIHLLDPMEEIAKAPALWLWDYLRRSGARGFFMPLAGDINSSATAAIIASMADLVLKSVDQNNEETLSQLRRIV